MNGLKSLIWLTYDYCVYFDPVESQRLTTKVQSCSKSFSIRDANVIVDVDAKVVN